MPLEYAQIENFVAEAINRKTTYEFEAVSDDDLEKTKAFQKVWDYDWAKKDREEEILKNEYITAIF